MFVIFLDVCFEYVGIGLDSVFNCIVWKLFVVVRNVLYVKEIGFWCNWGYGIMWGF